MVEDRVLLSDLRYLGRHGVTAEERSTPQEFAVEIECPTDAHQAAERDDIAATLDYRQLSDIARRVIEGPSRHLVETLADSIAEQALAELAMRWVRVRVAKLRPGSVPGAAAIEVRREARRARGDVARPTVELHVPDFAPVKDFYGRLGFVTAREERGEDGYLVLRRGLNVIAFWPGSPAVVEHPYFARFGSATPRGYGVEIVIEVADVAALYESARGFAEIVAPLERRPWGARDFRVADPFGFYLRITEPLSR